MIDHSNPIDTQRLIVRSGVAFQSNDFTLFQCARRSSDLGMAFSRAPEDREVVL
jgi:hypothetical protein